MSNSNANTHLLTTMNQLSQLNLTNISEEEELKLLNFPSKREDLTTAIPLTVIFALLLVTGCIGNLCTAIVIARPKNKYMHTATNYYLFSLAMSDFLFLILGLPQEMYQIWQRYPYVFGEAFCIIRGYLSEASTYASILTISAFTIERYVAICHPLWAHTMSQLPRAITSIVIIWCLAAICAIPPAAELGIMTQKGPITNRTLEQSAQCATKRTIFENMFVVSAIVFFIVPMIIVTVLYILIAIELRRSSKMNSAISKQTSSHLNTSNSNSIGAHSGVGATTCRCCAMAAATAAAVSMVQAYKHQSHCPLSAFNNNSSGKFYNSNPRSPPTPSSQTRQHHKQRNGHCLASKSQQHLSLSICDAGQQGVNTNLNLQQQAGTKLANQRPSSAIGSFEVPSSYDQQQPQQNGSRLTTPLARLWPLVNFWSASQTNVAATCGCRCHSNVGHLATPQQQQQFNFITTVDGQPAAANLNTDSIGSRHAHDSANKRPVAAASLPPEPPPQHCNSLGDLFSGSGSSPTTRTTATSNSTATTATTATTTEQAEAENPIITKPSSATLTKGEANFQSANGGKRSGLVASVERESSQQQQQQQQQHLHSPLSYHESLIQHQQRLTPHHSHHHHQHHHCQAANHQQINQSIAPASKLLHPLVAHQMSLTTSAVGFASRLRSQGSISSNQHVNQKQQMYQYQLAHQQHQQQRRSRSAASSKKSVVRMLVAVVVSFFICWVPFHAQRLLASYLVKDENQNQVLLDIYLKLTYISGVMYYLSSTINPLLYQLMSAKFRLAFKETFNCSLFRCAIFSTSNKSNGHLVNYSNNQTYNHHTNNNCNNTITNNYHFNTSGHSPTNSMKERALAVSGARATGSQHLGRWDSKTSDMVYQKRSSGALAAGLECLCSPIPMVAVPAVSRAESYAGSGGCQHQHQHENQEQPLYTRERPRRAPPLSAIARLRGRINSSVSLLFRFSGPAEGLSVNHRMKPETSQDASCDYCACNGTVQSTMTTAAAAVAAATSSQGRQNNIASSDAIGGGNSDDINNNEIDTTREGEQEVEAGADGATPLLSQHHNYHQGSQQSKAKSSLSSSNPRMGGSGSHLSQRLGFPAHSMLKFVRSPTGSTGALAGGAGGQCLTRLSSHGDDDEERERESGHAIEAHKLDSLIRATMDDDDDDGHNDDNNELEHGFAMNEEARDGEPQLVNNVLQLTSTSGSSGNSSGSSPDQLTTSNSISQTPSGELSVLVDEQQQQQEGRKLGLSKSANATTSQNKQQQQQQQQPRVKIHSNSNPSRELRGGGSSSSGTGDNRHLTREKASSGSSSSSSGGGGGNTGHSREADRTRRAPAEYQKASSRRRRSLQQMHNSYLIKMAQNNNNNNNNNNVEIADSNCCDSNGGNRMGEGNQDPEEDSKRRKSSSSSAAATNHQNRSRHLSSSLSSSERQLDKKLSFSTTTSALEDYGSYTTTNSQLTGVLGSQAQLSMAATTSRRESFISSPVSSSPPNSPSTTSSSSSASSCNSLSAAIEKDPATVIPGPEFCSIDRNDSSNQLANSEKGDKVRGRRETGKVSSSEKGVVRKAASSKASKSMPIESLVPLLVSSANQTLGLDGDNDDDHDDDEIEIKEAKPQRQQQQPQ